MHARSTALHQAYALAWIGWPILLFYAGAQAALSAVVANEYPHLKLVFEPYLLLIGLILHVQWRRVARIYRICGLPRPMWILAGDCLSFVITLWAFTVLLSVFWE